MPADQTVTVTSMNHPAVDDSYTNITSRTWIGANPNTITSQFTVENVNVEPAYPPMVPKWRSPDRLIG